MDRANQSVPWLTPEVQANPHTRILVNGLEVELWQVAHLYGVNHDVPDPMIRSGATSTNIRALYSRPRDEEMASSYPPSDTYAGTTTEGRPLPDSPTLPSRTSVHRGLQCSSVCDDESHGLDTHDLLRMIDELVDEAWLNEAGEEETEYATTASEAAPLGTLTDAERTALSPLPLYANLSFPPPPYPPPTAPLPPLPHDERYGQSLVVLPGTELSSRETELAESLEIDRDNDTASDRTITPISSRRRLATTPQTREVPMPTARVAVERPKEDRHLGEQYRPGLAMLPGTALSYPVTGVSKSSGKLQRTITPTASRIPLATTRLVREVSMPTRRPEIEQPTATMAAKRAASASIFRNHGADTSYRHRQQDAALTGSRPKSPPSILQRPLPNFMQNLPKTRVAVQQPGATPPVIGRAASASVLQKHGAGSYQNRQQDAGLTGPRPKSPRSILTNPLPKFPHKPPPTARMPGVTQVVGRATSASIIRNHGPDGYRHYQQDAGLNEPLPKLPLSVVQHPLPSFLQNPPLFLQHPPDFSQQPPQYQRPRGDTGESPRPIKSKSSPNLEGTKGVSKSKSFSSMATTPVPTRPVTPAADGDTGLTSRWSPDSSPEISRFKRVRNKFSLARLQPQKSRLFQTENEADESAAPVGNSTSDPSGPRRGSRKASQ